MWPAATVIYDLGVVEFHARNGGVGYLLCLGSTRLQGKTKAPDHDCCHNDDSTSAEAAVSFFIDADGVEYLPTEGYVWVC
jgi:hypothetical protein